MKDVRADAGLKYILLRENCFCAERTVGMGLIIVPTKTVAFQSFRKHIHDETGGHYLTNFTQKTNISNVY
jgi:hypothetical protein